LAFSLVLSFLLISLLLYMPASQSLRW
jgi:hypothetical protein